MIPIAKLAHIQYIESLTYLSVSRTDRGHWLCYAWVEVSIAPANQTMEVSKRSPAQNISVSNLTVQILVSTRKESYEPR